MYGFRNVTTAYITVNLTPDHPGCPAEMAHTIIESNRQNELDNAENLLHIANEVVSPSEVDALKRLVNARYDQRRLLYDQGFKQWDAMCLSPWWFAA